MPIRTVFSNQSEMFEFQSLLESLQTKKEREDVFLFRKEGMYLDEHQKFVGRFVLNCDFLFDLSKHRKYRPRIEIGAKHPFSKHLLDKFLPPKGRRLVLPFVRDLRSLPAMRHLAGLGTMGEVYVDTEKLEGFEGTAYQGWVKMPEKDYQLEMLKVIPEWLFALGIYFQIRFGFANEYSQTWDIVKDMKQIYEAGKRIDCKMLAEKWLVTLGYIYEVKAMYRNYIFKRYTFEEEFLYFLPFQILLYMFFSLDFCRLFGVSRKVLILGLYRYKHANYNKGSRNMARLKGLLKYLKEIYKFEIVNNNLT